MTDVQEIRVMIVDDHPLMRSGIAGEINSQRDMQVVAEASNGVEAIAAYRVHRPDVTLMDIRMPDMGGIEAITQIRATYPAAKFVVLTSSAGDVQAMRALQAGATGYLLKNLLRTELIDTIRVVHSGRRKIPAEIAQQIAEHAMEDVVSARELEVLRGVSQGKANKIIADDLCISEHTVKNHIKSILSKLDASDRTDAVVIAIRRGYIEM
ncbi:DNA-binding NarL/FixJ family response regulator [Granulicella aggregans]|uniref:DNA-binding NarL/FixJ family response regulator n=1 Tax=Granulicella aggregans TaxID=474949 RepID=A0A7W7ZGN6_9BACT|nr:response regulator transcription factor [Granulicella aggregans]MBB5059590.1 DNA-binding NarL/FixJ family response regulator [Granulicella aggregans]